MEPKIENLLQKKLVGKRMTMSFADNKTFNLWQSFMPRRKEIQNTVSTDLFSVQIYSEPLILGDVNQKFEKWAAVEVVNFGNVPNELETFTLQSGLYAIFHYKGLSTDHRIFVYIFTQWLPNSNYLLDNRPHVEILGEKYKNGDPNSEEEIWIPIKKKQ